MVTNESDVASEKRIRVPSSVTTFIQTVMIVFGLGVVVVSFAAEWISGANSGFGLGQTLLTCIGAVLVVYGAVLRWLPIIFTKAALALIVLLLFMSGIEAICHLIGYDFNSTSSVWNATPVYFRKPTHRVGDVYFRRSGNGRWKGKVMTAWLKHRRVVEVDAYVNEPVVTITYDEKGFRNPSRLADWSVVFVGDSFTELGHLPYEDLFTTIVGQRLGITVKNLAVADTGTRTHIFYLNEYGSAPSCTDAFLVFFEGNDIRDLCIEDEAYEKWVTKRERPTRDLASARQPSFIVALGQTALWHTTPFEESVNATCTLNGHPISITVQALPPNPDTMNATDRKRFEFALRDWSVAANSHGMRPWLVYMPCKRRVLDGHIKFLEGVRPDLVNWEPNNLPDYVKRHCGELQINFIDVTPTLNAETRRGNLTYNHVGDTHLNLHGSQVVGEMISEHLLRKDLKRREQLKQTPQVSDSLPWRN